MTELRLVAAPPEPELSEDAGPFAGTPLPRRLPPGRHGIPANVVREHQRRRLLAAMAAELAIHGYANVTTTHVSEAAGVSTSTFYKHFGNLWDCVLAAYVEAADLLCAEIEAACAKHDSSENALTVSIEGSRALLLLHQPGSGPAAVRSGAAGRERDRQRPPPADLTAGGNAEEGAGVDGE